MRFARFTITLFSLCLAVPASAELSASGTASHASASLEANNLAASSTAAAGDRASVGSLADTLPRRAPGSGSLASGAESRGFGGEIIPTAAALGGTLLAIVLARSAIRRFGGKLAAGRRPSGVVEILARYPVARGQQVVLLKVGRRVLVVHQGAQVMQTLSEFSSADDVADILTRCEAGAKNAKDPSRDFSFDAILRSAGKSFEQDVRTGAAAGIDPRDTLPAVLRGAEIETVDLTRGRRGGSR
ncbi:MAG: flagellar biosynthetic protein FliO [bacterium]